MNTKMAEGILKSIHMSSQQIRNAYALLKIFGYQIGWDYGFDQASWREDNGDLMKEAKPVRLEVIRALRDIAYALEKDIE